MAEIDSQFGHCEGVKSKPFNYMGDIFLEEQQFLSKLTDNAVMWFEFPQLERVVAWYLFREKGDFQATFAKEYCEFVKKINNIIKNGGKIQDGIKEPNPSYLF